MRIIILVVCFFIVLSFVQSDDPNIGGTAFSKNLIKHLFTHKWTPRYIVLGKNNALVSPFSLRVILMTLAQGAHGESLLELIRVLGLSNFPSSLADLKPRYVQLALGQLDSVSSSKSGVLLHSANKIFISDAYQLNPVYVGEVGEWYRTEVQTVNFSEAQVTEDLINKWVGERTNHRITEIVTFSDFGTRYASVLVSTLYFSGLWKEGRFLIQEDTFYMSGNAGIKKKMLVDIREARYMISEDLSAEILELPFEGDGDVSMLFFLPIERNGLAALQGAIARQPDVLWSVALPKAQQMTVTIPVFNIEASLNLQDILSSMGVKQIFEQDGQLDKISPGIHIEDMVQKIFINVTADGVEAAAAANAGISLHALPRNHFKANHPFVFSVRMGPDNILLFSGIYSGTDSR